MTSSLTTREYCCLERVFRFALGSSRLLLLRREARRRQQNTPRINANTTKATIGIAENDVENHEELMGSFSVLRKTGSDSSTGLSVLTGETIGAAVGGRTDAGGDSVVVGAGVSSIALLEPPEDASCTVGAAGACVDSGSKVFSAATRFSRMACGTTTSSKSLHLGSCWSSDAAVVEASPNAAHSPHRGSGNLSHI